MIIDLDPGLRIWRIPHPDWEPSDGGDRVVTSVCAEEGGEVAVHDRAAFELALDRAPIATD